MAALAAGSEIIQLRHITHGLGLGADLCPALAAVAQGDSASAIVHLTRLDAALATRSSAGPLRQTVLRARGGVIVLSETLSQHANYFNGGAADEIHRN
jgi:hypothetical protein